MLSTPSRRNAGLKPISSGSPLEVAGQRFAPLADLLGLRRDRQLARRERQPQRRAAGQHLDAGDHVGELGARQRDLVLERLGQQPAELGELPLDAASSEPDVSRPEQHLVLLDDDLQAVAFDRGGDADEIRQCARGDDRGEVFRRPALEGRGAHRHAIGVGRGHREHAACELDEDAGQDGAGIVARSGSQDALRRREEGAAVDSEGTTVIDIRQSREIIGIVGVQRVAAGAAFEREKTGPVAGGEHDLLRRQVAHDVE